MSSAAGGLRLVSRAAAVYLDTDVRVGMYTRQRTACEASEREEREREREREREASVEREREREREREERARSREDAGRVDRTESAGPDGNRSPRTGPSREAERPHDGRRDVRTPQYSITARPFYGKLRRGGRDGDTGRKSRKKRHGKSPHAHRTLVGSRHSRSAPASADRTINSYPIDRRQTAAHTDTRHFLAAPHSISVIRYHKLTDSEKDGPVFALTSTGLTVLTV
jgi:hypothetical protein